MLDQFGVLGPGPCPRRPVGPVGQVDPFDALPRTSRDTDDLSLPIPAAIAVSVAFVSSPSAIASLSGNDRYRTLVAEGSAAPVGVVMDVVYRVPAAESTTVPSG